MTIKHRDKLNGLLEWRQQVEQASEIWLKANAIELGRQVRLRREHYGFTQSQLASLLGTAQSRVSEIEEGKHKLTVRTLVKLSNVLNMPLIVKFDNSYLET